MMFDGLVAAISPLLLLGLFLFCCLDVGIIILAVPVHFSPPNWMATSGHSKLCLGVKSLRLRELLGAHSRSKGYPYYWYIDSAVKSFKIMDWYCRIMKLSWTDIFSLKGNMESRLLAKKNQIYSPLTYCWRKRW